MNNKTHENRSFLYINVVSSMVLSCKLGLKDFGGITVSIMFLSLCTYVLFN